MILVTGGAGFIGSHVVDKLVEMGEKVIILDDLSGGFSQNVHSDASATYFFDGSITDSKLVDELFEEYNFDYVIHTAAYAAEGLSHFIRHYNYTNNVLGSINLINASIRHKVKRFVFTSSMSVYGSATPPFTENMTPAPEDPYAIAKYAIEMDLQVAQSLHGLDYTIFRPHNVYGERQNLSDPYRNVAAIFMRQMLTNQPVTIFGDGNQTRAFSYISDIAPYIARSIYQPAAQNEIFNIGGDVPCSINGLLNLMSTIMDVKPDKVHYPERYEVKYAFSDHSKANKLLNRQHPVPFTWGLKRMADWAKTYDFSRKTKMPPIELTDKLPTKWAAYLK